MTRDWHEWHTAYDIPDSPLSQRLAIVQQHLRDALDAMPPGDISVVSLCAGEGRDLLGVLADHPRRADVRGRLVELDPALCAVARKNAPAGIEVTEADAGDAGSYAGAVPADVVLVCGVFGNLTDDDMWGTLERLPEFCRTGAVVIWTRHRRAPDATVRIREIFAARGFEEVGFSSAGESSFAVGCHRYTGTPESLAHERLFTFVGYDELGKTCQECGFSYDAERGDAMAWLPADSAAFVVRFGRFDDSAARHKPAPDVWSPLEYACHVRDVLIVQRERVELAQREEEPEFVPMQRDERAIETRYNEQDPATVAREIEDATTAFVQTLRDLDDAGWQRRGLYNYPSPMLRTCEWIAIHTVHELLHHRGDIGTLA